MGWGRQALPRVGDERNERAVWGLCAPAGREGLWGGESRWLEVGFGAGQLLIRLFGASNSSDWAGTALVAGSGPSQRQVPGLCTEGRVSLCEGGRFGLGDEGSLSLAGEMPG